MKTDDEKHNCRVGTSYPTCKAGEVCEPVEGSFVTECEVKDCKNFN